jgi:EAL domain-containing protein (putative c-di-GMP-specific phosphodiesterase class I)
MMSSIENPEESHRRISEFLNEFDVRHNQLILEVVETEEVENRKKLLETLNYYREKGVNIALDDFGTGYSSIGLLSELRPDYLKISMDLVHSVDSDSFRARLASDLLKSAQDHGITTVAGGIETEEQYKWFRDNGVDLLQGYYVKSPEPKPPETVDLSTNGDSATAEAT